MWTVVANVLVALVEGILGRIFKEPDPKIKQLEDELKVKDEQIKIVSERCNISAGDSLSTNSF